MNPRQRQTVEYLHNKISRKRHIRTEQVYIIDFGRRVVYEIETGSSNPLGQDGITYTIGPRGGIVNEQQLY